MNYQPYFAGVWNSDTVYSINDFVYSDNDTFVCVMETKPGIELTNGNYWRKVVDVPEAPEPSRPIVVTHTIDRPDVSGTVTYTMQNGCGLIAVSLIFYTNAVFGTIIDALPDNYNVVAASVGKMIESTQYGCSSSENEMCYLPTDGMMQSKGLTVQGSAVSNSSYFVGCLPFTYTE